MKEEDAAARPPDRLMFERLYRAHYAELTRFAARRVGADTAGDIVAGTFLVAWRRLPEIPPAHPRAWLYATARHLIANELRARTRRDRLTDKAVAVQPRADDHAAHVDERVRVRAVLAELSPADQEVLRLTEWEGLDVAEAALVLGCTRTALKVRLHRARRRFARRLAATEGDDGSAATERDDGSAVHPPRSQTPKTPTPNTRTPKTQTQQTQTPRTQTSKTQKPTTIAQGSPS